MSDGMMEAYRDQCRATEEEALLARLVEHMERPSDATWAALQGQAAVCDAVRGGSSYGTRWTVGLGERVTRMLEGDREIWGKLLQDIIRADRGYLTYGVGLRLHEASPFAGKVLLSVGSSSSENSYSSEARNAVILAIRTAGHEASGGAGFLIAVDAFVLQGADVVQTRMARAA
jgi:hypothetical protein